MFLITLQLFTSAVFSFIILPMADKNRYVIGFDLGGTKMIGAVIQGERVLSRCKKKTGAEEGPEAVLRRITGVIKTVVKEAGLTAGDIEGVSMAVPGPHDREKGIMVYTPNLGFRDFPIKELLEKEVGITIHLENDVNSGTYGEYKLGAGKGYSHVIGLFPGTGIGGGIVLNGRLYRGATGNAGEIGHMIIQADGALCGCGQHGCLEALASRTALTKDTIAAASAGKAPKTYKIAGSDFKNYKSRVFAQAYKNNEQAVIEIIERSAWYMGIGMANCVNIFNPEVFVLGGGVVEKLGTKYVKLAEKSMRAHALEHLSKDVHVVEAQLEDDAVLLGAAHLLLDEGK